MTTTKTDEQGFFGFRAPPGTLAITELQVREKDRTTIAYRIEPAAGAPPVYALGDATVVAMDAAINQAATLIFDYEIFNQ